VCTWQVLSGVAPLERRDRESLGAQVIDKLRRQLVDLEALALQKEMGSLDDGDDEGAPAEVERLKMQLADQHRRIREVCAARDSNARLCCRLEIALTSVCVPTAAARAAR
jgi:hypothetical protein